MNWLRENAYISEWLALPVAIAIFWFQNRKKKLAQINWSLGMVYLALLISLAVSFGPQFDHDSKLFARSVVFFCIGFVAVRSRPSQ